MRALFLSLEINKDKAATVPSRYQAILDKFLGIGKPNFREQLLRNGLEGLCLFLDQLELLLSWDKSTDPFCCYVIDGTLVTYLMVLTL